MDTPDAGRWGFGFMAQRGFPWAEMDEWETRNLGKHQLINTHSVTICAPVRDCGGWPKCTNRNRGNCCAAVA